MDYGATNKRKALKKEIEEEKKENEISDLDPNDEEMKTLSFEDM